MDRTTETLASYASSLSYEQLTPAAIHCTRRLWLDSLGCAIGGYDSEPAQIARRLAARSSGTPAARVWGSGAATSMEAATFANTIMVRYLDFNDMYISLEAGHASDMLPALLAVAEAHGCTGRELVTASAVACEMFTALADTFSLWNKGWDHGLLVCLGTAAGVGKLLGLDIRKMGEALSLAITANLPLRQTRSGELSMWKGCATSASARAGLFAAQLAAEGMTGPLEAFEGRHGLWEQVTKPFTLDALGAAGKGFGVERLALKYFPTEGHSQLPLYFAIKALEQMEVGDIESVLVTVYRFAFTEIGSELQKWDPQTRETADHSLPYMLAAALQDGRIDVQTFGEERIRDPALRPLMNRIKIVESPSFSSRYPIEMPCKLEIVSRSGKRFEEEGNYPRGHHKNPLTDAEVNAKFKTQCEGRLPAGRQDAVMDAVWRLGESGAIESIIDSMVIDVA